MKIVMIEPLGLKKEEFYKLAKPLTLLGHEFVYCGAILKENEKIDIAKDAQVLIIGNGKLDSSILKHCKNLKMISVGFTGVDHVDLDFCRKNSIVVCNAQGYATDSTAEMTIGLILASLRNIPSYNKDVLEGKDRENYVNNTLNGKTLGIIGTGSIGLKVAKIAKVFGAKLIGYNPRIKIEGEKLGIIYKDLDDVFIESDIITIHTPLNNSTRNLVNKKRIFSMKKNSILINTSRGAIVDSEALAQALNEKRIGKAAIDVFETEPPIKKNHPLINAKNVILTPHVGFLTNEALKLRGEIVIENILAWLKGSPINVK